MRLRITSRGKLTEEKESREKECVSVTVSHKVCECDREECVSVTVRGMVCVCDSEGHVCVIVGQGV